MKRARDWQVLKQRQWVGRGGEEKRREEVVVIEWRDGARGTP